MVRLAVICGVVLVGFGVRAIRDLMTSPADEPLDALTAMAAAAALSSGTVLLSCAAAFAR